MDKCANPECGHLKGQHAKGKGECYAGVRPSGEPMEEGRDYTQVQCSCPAFVPVSEQQEAELERMTKGENDE